MPKVIEKERHRDSREREKRKRRRRDDSCDDYEEEGGISGERKKNKTRPRGIDIEIMEN